MMTTMMLVMMIVDDDDDEPNGERDDGTPRTPRKRARRAGEGGPRGEGGENDGRRRRGGRASRPILGLRPFRCCGAPNALPRSMLSCCNQMLDQLHCSRIVCAQPYTPPHTQYTHATRVSENAGVATSTRRALCWCCRAAQVGVHQVPPAAQPVDARAAIGADPDEVHVRVRVPDDVAEAPLKHRLIRSTGPPSPSMPHPSCARGGAST